MILAGVYCLLQPAMTYMTLGYVVGVNMLMDAIGNVLLWHERKKEGSADGWALAGTLASGRLAYC